MAGYSDRAMRYTVHRAGAELSVSEMVSAKALVYRDKKTPLLARVLPDEGPVAVQIFGSEPAVMAEAAATVSAGLAGGIPPAAIDINMGCPMPKITGNGEGSALMRDPTRVEAITRAVKEAVRIPVTVKIRAGWDDKSKNAVEVALAAEAGGAAAVTVHGRTRTQLYTGRVDYAVIAAVKEAVCIPVVGNGDVVSVETALRMRRETHCDGIMIARGAVGNPFIFTELTRVFSGEEYTPPTREEVIGVAIEQLQISVAEKGEYRAVREARKQMLDYVRGLRGATDIRGRIALAEDAESVRRALLDSLLLEKQD